MDETTAGAPSLLGNYRLERLLGRGGMGAVFLAYDTTLHRRVALKMLDDSGPPGTSSERLLREARNAAALNHPNICTIHEVGSADGAAFIAMEFVDGRSLRDRIDRGPLPLDQAISIGGQAADGLAYAHANGVVHRDFKAANVIVSDTGRLKIVDFGLARRDDAAMMESTMMSAVPAGVAAGTPYAMAPEQVRGERADARADVWALGVLMYEMIAGRKPFAAATVPELFSSILRDAPGAFPESTPPQLRAIVERCLEKDPQRRYADGAAIAAVLQQVSSAGALTRVDRLRRLWPIAALIALALIGVAMWRGSPPAPASNTTAAAAVSLPSIRLAVLPFNNLTGDPDQEFFVDGLTDEAITQLGRLHPERLSVIARTSAMRYKNTVVPIDQIGKALGVEYLLEGSTRREGNRVRVTATLIQARDQTQLWTETFEYELASMMSLQNDVARGVARSLALTLLPDEQRRLNTAATVHPEAYDAYLRGTGHAGKLSRADLDRALEYFELAIAKDPGFALGYAGIGRVWTNRQQMQFASPREAGPRIRAALTRANQLDDSLPEVHAYLAAMLTWTDWNWAEGGKAFERALALRPNFAEARAFHAHYLMIMKRPDAAMAEMERALALDPFNDLIQALAGVVLTSVHRYDEAIAQFRKAIETSPRSNLALNGLARTTHHAGRFGESLEWERRLWGARDNVAMQRALAGSVGAYRIVIRRAADTLAAQMRASGDAPLAVALLYARAGARDQALEWLQRSYEMRDPNVPYIAAGPNWASFGDDPGFVAVYKKLGLP